VAPARRAGFDGLRGRTLDDTRHDANLKSNGTFAPQPKNDTRGSFRAQRTRRRPRIALDV
jgi:hypothetical protein